jgi:hypothetical protein
MATATVASVAQKSALIPEKIKTASQPFRSFEDFSFGFV